MKRVIVIGLGIFGFNIVKDLFEGGFESSPSTRTRKLSRRSVTSPRKRSSPTARTEIMDIVGIHEDDVVIVSFGEDLAAATLTTLHLKQMKVKEIIVKAPNEEHKLILEKVAPRRS